MSLLLTTTTTGRTLYINTVFPKSHITKNGISHSFSSKTYSLSIYPLANLTTTQQVNATLQEIRNSHIPISPTPPCANTFSKDKRDERPQSTKMSSPTLTMVSGTTVASTVETILDFIRRSCQRVKFQLLTR